MGRIAGLEKLLGSEGVARIQQSKVLLVGAGGIGCEVVKDLSLSGFKEIHIVDLDTIDLSNLNRQFLFGPEHIKQSKAKVAADVAGKFNPNVHIYPHDANIITDPLFKPSWFKQFNVAFNALDNAEARRHVNRMCVSTGVPLIDCGTAGFSGQVQVILPGKSECYDCRSHPAPTQYPVCTIRSTPSQPIHCVLWSKSYLFNLLFGEDSVSSEVPDTNGADEDAGELENLRKEHNELAELKKNINSPDFVSSVIQKVYVVDIDRLASANEEMWIGRSRPVPLDIKPASVNVNEVEDQDQRIWSPSEALAVFKDSAEKLAKRAPLNFDKDDDDALTFVAAATVLRSHIFGIEQKSKFDIKEIAGNIIPAIASTNAVVSGMGVVEALKIVCEDYDDLRSVNIWRDGSRALIGDRLAPPSDECPVSSVARTTLRAPSSSTLEVIIEEVLKGKLGYDEVGLVTDKLIYDPDFEDNIQRSLKDLNLLDNFVTVVDDDDRRVNLELYVAEGDEITVESIDIPLRPSVKRSRETDEDDVDLPQEPDVIDLSEGPTKKQKTSQPVEIL